MDVQTRGGGVAAAWPNRHPVRYLSCPASSSSNSAGCSKRGLLLSGVDDLLMRFPSHCGREFIRSSRIKLRRVSVPKLHLGLEPRIRGVCLIAGGKGGAYPKSPFRDPPSRHRRVADGLLVFPDAQPSQASSFTSFAHLVLLRHNPVGLCGRLFSSSPNAEIASWHRGSPTRL